MGNGAEDYKERQAAQEDPLAAIPGPAEGCRSILYTEGRLKELCGGHLFALYTDGDEDCVTPLLLDGRVLPEKLREHSQYVRLVISVRGEEQKS